MNEALRMKEAQRINELRRLALILRTEHPGDSEEMECAKHVGADAIERLTPTKPLVRTDVFGDRSPCCPNCYHSVTNYWVRGANPLHCQFCGQALDWGEEAEKPEK